MKIGLGETTIQYLWVWIWLMLWVKKTTMRVQEFSYIQQTYNALPSWWDDPNRSFAGWLIDNGSAMIADPVNLIGYGVGGQVAKQGYKEALKQALKGKMAKEINERVC